MINYDLPNNRENYIHRIGRTGRVGHRGKATSFFDPHNESDGNMSSQLVDVGTGCSNIYKILDPYSRSARSAGFSLGVCQIPLTLEGLIFGLDNRSWTNVCNSVCLYSRNCYLCNLLISGYIAIYSVCMKGAYLRIKA